MDSELINLKDKSEIKKSELMKILVRLSKTISVFDQMQLSANVKSDLKDIQGGYQEGFAEIYVKNFILRINEVREQKTSYKDDFIDKDNYCDAIDLLILQENNREDTTDNDEKFRVVYTIISLYTTFIIDEPIHPVDSPFPGHQKVEYKNGTYYCPVKKNNENNPQALCRFCIAKQSIIS